jgi:hypothetical protein
MTPPPCHWRAITTSALRYVAVNYGHLPALVRADVPG